MCKELGCVMGRELEVFKDLGRGRARRTVEMSQGRVWGATVVLWTGELPHAPALAAPLRFPVCVVFQGPPISASLGMCSAWSQLSVRAHKRLESRHEKGSQQSLAW